MNSKRFVIRNREALALDRDIFPLLQHLARIQTSSGVIRRVAPVDLESAPQRDWIVYRGDNESGFAIKNRDEGGEVSSLQRSLDYVRCAHEIVRSFGGIRSFPFELSLGDSPSDSWRTSLVEGIAGSLWCSSSVPAPKLPLQAVEHERDPLVRARIFGVVSARNDVEVGSEIVCDEIATWMPELGIHGRCVCATGGGLAMEVQVCGESGGVESEQQHIPGVRLDLGEIEMRLSDIVGLRPGAVIDLGDVALERCHVRLGATVLAEGRFTSRDGKLLLMIDAVI